MDSHQNGVMGLETTIGTQTEAHSYNDIEGGCAQSDDLLSHITETGEDGDDNYAKIFSKECRLNTIG